MLQLAVLGAIALFLILRLRSILGTRTGFEPGPEADAQERRANFEVIDGDSDQDIADHVALDSDTGKALLKMKKAEPSFNLNEFMGGAKQAYEMILMAFENGDQETLSQFLSKDVFDGFMAVIDDRQAKGLIVNAEFVGLREIKLQDATFNGRSKEGEITLAFTGELTSEIVDTDGKVVEGDRQTIKRQKDIWTFARKMGSDDPNWQLVATGG
ncbi:MAG: Tim44/TimA family putative adaptor protein [Pseudomonadota bacterium]